MDFENLMSIEALENDMKDMEKVSVNSEIEIFDKQHFTAVLLLKGIKQKDIGKVVGLTQQSISKKLKYGTFTLVEVMKILEYLDMKFEQLFVRK